MSCRKNARQFFTPGKVASFRALSPLRRLIAIRRPLLVLEADVGERLTVGFPNAYG
jgi:hypothetical protein